MAESAAQRCRHEPSSGHAADGRLAHIDPAVLLAHPGVGIRLEPEGARQAVAAPADLGAPLAGGQFTGRGRPPRAIPHDLSTVTFGIAHGVFS